MGRDLRQCVTPRGNLQSAEFISPVWIGIYLDEIFTGRESTIVLVIFLNVFNSLFPNHFCPSPWVLRYLVKTCKKVTSWKDKVNMMV